MYYPIHSNAEDRLNMNVTLLDIDEGSLQIAKEQMVSNGFHPSMIETAHCDITQMTDCSLQNRGGSAYDTIAMNGVLHSIPLSMDDKLPRILEGLAIYMDAETCFFGSTIPNIPVDGYSSFARNYMQILQKTQSICNDKDTVKAVDEIMDRFFESYEIKEIGYGMTFQGSKFKKTPDISEEAILDGAVCASKTLNDLL